MNTDKVKYFLMFMGYPRSGHTLAASILNAHPNVVCSNQKFIIHNAHNRNLEGILSNIANGSTPPYWKQEVRISPPQNSIFSDIYIVGDKTGHRTVEYLIDNPEQLDNLKSIIPWPMKWIHIVRNPFDCLSTWTKKNYDNKIANRKKTTPQAEFNNAFQKFKELNKKIQELKKTEDVMTVKHERLVRNKDKVLTRFSNFLKIEKTKEWRDAVFATIWKTPRMTRKQVAWSPQMRKRVMDLNNEYQWLRGYAYGG